MLCQEIPVRTEGSLPGSKLVVYIQDHSESLYIKERPMVLLCPGGAYAYTSDREAESIALQFLAMGCHAARTTSGAGFSMRSAGIKDRTPAVKNWTQEISTPSAFGDT